MFRLYTKLVAVTLLSLFVLAPQAAGAANGEIGQTQTYTVRLRGNGSAIVSSRFTINNNGETKQTVYRYTNDAGTIRNVTAIQQIYCGNLPYYVPNQDPASVSNQSPIFNNKSITAKTDIPECYSDTPSTASLYGTYGSQQKSVQYYIPSYSYIYKHVTIKQTGQTITATMPVAVAPSESTTLVLMYDVSGVAKKNLGRYSYDFKTLKANERVNSVTVAVDVENGYVLAGGTKQKTNYAPETISSGANALSITNGTSLNSTQQRAADTYVNSIGTYGMITEKSSMLAPNESMSVTGMFASSSFLLHWPRTVAIIGVILLLIAVLIWWVVRRRKQLAAARAAQPTQVATEPKDGKTAQQEPAAISDETAAEDTSPIVITQNTYAPAQQQKFISLNLELLPFYSQFSRMARAFHERRVSPVLFGWMCALLGLGAIGLASVGYAGAIGLSSGVYGSIGWDIVSWILFVCITMAGGLGALLACIGLPIWYAQNTKTVIRIIVHAIGMLVMVALVLMLLLLVFKRESSPRYYDDTPTIYNGNLSQ